MLRQPSRVEGLVSLQTNYEMLGMINEVLKLLWVSAHCGVQGIEEVCRIGTSTTRLGVSGVRSEIRS